MQPLLAPGPDNQCILAASIHLPQSQQARFCLGGRYRACSRFQRQQDRPLPRYVTGVAAGPAPPPPPARLPEMRTLPWRQPWGRQLLRLLLLTLWLTLAILAWQWRQSTLAPVAREVGDLTPPRPPITRPTPDASFAGEMLSPYHPRPIGPRQR